MNVKRFHARTAREALALARQAFGEDAVVLSTKPCAEGVEVLALAPESVGMESAEPVRTAAAPVASAAVEDVGDDEIPAMSTLSFRDYVRERMQRRRQADAEQGSAAGRIDAAVATDEGPAHAPAVAVPTLTQVLPAAAPAAPRSAPEPIVLATARPDAVPAPRRAAEAAPAALRQDQADVMAELRAMKGMIEERFGTLAFMDRMQRQPTQARLSQKLLDAGFSPALTRSMIEHLDASVGDEQAWATRVLERNVLTGEHEAALEDQGGVYALIGATGVGKTTSTAKIAAAFAAKHGAANLGLITLDAYRVAAHEQLRAYGRILGVPVHTAHDRVTLEDLLDLLSAKKMVLIDTAGMGQRDARTRELLETLAHPSIQRLLVINAAAQGETIEDVMLAYGAQHCAGVVVSKMDEAVKMGPALDAVIRHKMKVVGVANGQRVPEDWHRMTAAALVHRALRTGASAPYRMDAPDANLLCASASRLSAGALSLAA